MRVLRWILAAVLLLAGVAPASAQGYPNRPVRVVVGFPAGGPTDIIARIVAQRLSDSLGQQFYVENIGGAGGNTASGQVARVTPDGYTIMAISTGFHGEPQPLRQGAVRSDQGFCRRDAGRGFAECRGGQPAGSGQDAAGTGAADPGQSRQIQLCRPRRRFDAASRRRAVSPDLQARPRPRPLHRRRAGRAVDRRRPHADRLHRAAVLDGGDPGRPGARDRHRGDGARASKFPTCRPSPSRASRIRRPIR